jgi:Stealth protein CR2, conserved region 2/Stealth protein CR1, conserved region 1/Stealth protein CR3, conserved region 3/Stealth protein CR4, conserved region 4
VTTAEALDIEDLMPRTARARLLDAVFEALDTAGIRAFAVRGASFPGPTVGVFGSDRAAALRALGERLTGPATVLQELYPNVQDQPARPLTPRRLSDLPTECAAIRIAVLHSSTDGALHYGLDYGTVIEFWADSADPDWVQAPRPNAAAQLIHRELLEPASIDVDGVPRPSAAVFDTTFLDDVDFPVDAVYTWVDDTDPAWRRRLAEATAGAEGSSHPEARSASRFRNRDELRYSLRSLEMYAPWIRRIWLVTDQQRPDWLMDTGRVTVVDHREIFTDPSVLPVFNSNAIISQLHHIDGLAEHYLYINDDVFFGRDVRPEQFWFGSGVAKVFPGDRIRPFGPVQATDLPPVAFTKNIRELLGGNLGRSVSAAIWHTPYPQMRSVNAELEARFPDTVRVTADRRFRTNCDVPLDQLFHYYARATGRAVPAHLDYDYVDAGSAATGYRLRRLLAARDRDAFCLNDVTAGPDGGIPDEAIAAFLRSYFPVPAAFEKLD